MNKARRKSMQGAVMVEFAIIVPILVLLAFGITELGRALYHWNTLTKVVATGARYMARSNGGLVTGSCGPGTTWSNHETKAKNLIIYGNGTEPLLPHLDDANVISITPRNGTGSFAGTCVIEVQAAVPFDWMAGPLIPYDVVGQISLRARTEERYIGE
jgi:hypothetical protein